MTQKYDDDKVHCPSKGRPEVASNVTKSMKGKVKKRTKTKPKPKTKAKLPAPPPPATKTTRASSRLATKKK